MKRILVGYDGSDGALRALQWAVAEARLHGAEVDVVHGFHPSHRAGVRDAAGGGDGGRAAASALVEEAVAAVADDGVVVSGRVLPVGTRAVPEALIRDGSAADLVVVGSRGRGGFAGLLLGSVSHQVAAHADVPVAVVPDTERTSWSRGAGIDPGPGGGRIVVGFDGSEHAGAALAWACTEAAERGAPLTICTADAILHSPYFDAIAGLDPAAASSMRTAAIERMHGEIARAAADRAPCGDVEIERRVVIAHPTRALLDAAGDAALLVVGSRGRGGFASLLLGSVGQQVLHHARVPVVVAR